MRHRLAKRVLVAGVAVLLALDCCGPAAAVEPDEMLSDPALEARARTISSELRCLVCQNQSIDDSNAPLARDLRLLVRERLVAGDSDAQVRNFVVARYGEFVLLRPVFAWHTLILWLTPVLLIAGAALFAWRAVKGAGGAQDREPGAPLDAEEEARLHRALSRAADDRGAPGSGA